MATGVPRIRQSREEGTEEPQKTGSKEEAAKRIEERGRKGEGEGGHARGGKGLQF